MSDNDVLTPPLPDLEALTADEWQALASTLPAFDLAEHLASYPVDRQLALLSMLEENQLADLFGYLPAERQDALLEEMEDSLKVPLIKALPADERVDIYQRMTEEQQQALLLRLAWKERTDILRLSSYDSGTAGALATSAYLAIPASIQVRHALGFLRKHASNPELETIYQLYVVDQQQRLIGTLSLRDLLSAGDNVHLSELMLENPVYVRASWPQARASEVIRDYDLLAVPVIDSDEKLIGIITVDDAMDADMEEVTEDFHKGGGTLALQGLSMKAASPWALYRKRVFWLVLLVFGNLFSGAGIAYFEETILAYVALVFFLPLLVDSGGNAGAQSATLMVRALATGDVVIKDWVHMLGRELVVALLLGLSMAAAVFSIGWYRGGPDIALVVSLSMVVIVIAGSLVGMGMPFLLSRLKLDPATASAPLITSIADALGVILYFTIATTFLSLS